MKRHRVECGFYFERNSFLSGAGGLDSSFCTFYRTRGFCLSLWHEAPLAKDKLVYLRGKWKLLWCGSQYSLKCCFVQLHSAEPIWALDSSHVMWSVKWVFCISIDMRTDYEQQDISSQRVACDMFPSHPSLLTFACWQVTHSVVMIFARVWC